jgi:TonB family protein
MRRNTLSTFLLATMIFATERGAFAQDPHQYEFSGKPCADGSKPHDPVPLRTPAPEYPLEARRARLQGTVWVDGRVLKNGQVVDVKIKQGVHRLLDEATLRAVSGWRYEPATCGDQPVDVVLLTYARFTLEK